MRGHERAILHVDGDAFFASCEVARNPALRGRPVVTGRERGIVSAATYEAKKLGIHRGMPIAKLRREFPQVAVLAGDYETYGMYAERLYAIVGRYAARVEKYGIDECFGDLTGQDAVLGLSHEAIALHIQEDLARALALSFSVGLAHTKALAKLGSKYRKPGGFTLITPENAAEHLAGTPIGSVWGIGRALSAQLEAQGVRTALDFSRKPREWVERKFAQPTVELWQELNGEAVWDLSDGGPEMPHSVQRTRTFSPASKDPAFLWSHLAGNVEGACVRARRDGLIPARVSFFLKSQDFRYRGDELSLPHPSDLPHEILAALRPAFLKAFDPGTRYRATGVTLFAFRQEADLQMDLWGARERSRAAANAFRAADRLERKYGTRLVSLASSLLAREQGAGRATAEERAYEERFSIPGTGYKHLPLPVLGWVS